MELRLFFIGDNYMTLEEAIDHALKVAGEADACSRCKSEHLQIAAWLQELQIYRKKEKGEKNG
jgi:hypothetical protein